MSLETNGNYWVNDSITNGGCVVEYCGCNHHHKIPTPAEQLYKLQMRRVEILNGIDATPPDAHVTTLLWVMELRHLEKCIKDLEKEVRLSVA